MLTPYKSSSNCNSIMCRFPETAAFLPFQQNLHAHFLEVLDFTRFTIFTQLRLAALSIPLLHTAEPQQPTLFPHVPQGTSFSSPTLELELQNLSPLDAQKCLTGQVKAARTLNDFSLIISAGGRLIDAICLVAILSGLPRAVQRAILLVVVPTASQPQYPTASATVSPAGGTGPAAPSQQPQQHPRAALQLSEEDSKELAALVAGLVALVCIRLREFDSNGLITVTVGLVSRGTPAVAPGDGGSKEASSGRWWRGRSHWWRGKNQ